MIKNKERCKVFKINKDVYNNKINYVIFTIKPLLVFENVFGIFRFTIEQGELVPPSKKVKFLGILMTITYITMGIIFLEPPEADAGYFIDIMDTIPSIVILIEYVSSSIIFLFILSSTCIEIFKRFAELDSMLLVRTTFDFYEVSRFRTIKYVLLVSVSYIISCTLDMVTDDEIMWGKILYYPIYFLEKLELLVFCKTITMATCRLEIINRYLMNFLEDNDRRKNNVFTVNDYAVNPEEKYNWIGRASMNNMKIRDLAIMYDKIGTICVSINKLFNFQIFMTLSSAFIYIVIAIWSSIYYYRDGEYSFGALMTIIIWCITVLLTVTLMSYVCERLLSVRNNAKVLVNKLIMDYDLPKSMRVQAKAFMELIEIWPLRFCIYDMFTLDITLILKFISVATTYLIVIIQLSHFI